MRVLLDECVDRKLKKHLAPHVVSTVQDVKWSGIKNGELLTRAEGEFDVFLTVDKNLKYQQNLLKAKIAVVLVMARNNNIRAILPLVPEILKALATLKSGQFVIVGS